MSEPAVQTGRTRQGKLELFYDSYDPSNFLENDVGGLWNYENWSRDVRRCRGHLKKRTYQSIVPALRLATLMLEKSLVWFWQLRFAKAKPKSGCCNGDNGFEFDPNEWTEESLQQIRGELDIIAQKYQIFHTFSRWEIRGTGGKQSIHAGQTSAKIHRLIRLIQSPKWPSVPLFAQQCYLFQLAVVLVRELAYKVGSNRSEPQVGWDNEAFVHDKVYDLDYGYCWERWMFGGPTYIVDEEVSAGHDDKTGRRLILASEDEWPHPFHCQVQVWFSLTMPGGSPFDLRDSADEWLMTPVSAARFFRRDIWEQWITYPDRDWTPIIHPDDAASDGGEQTDEESPEEHADEIGGVPIPAEPDINLARPTPPLLRSSGMHDTRPRNLAYNTVLEDQLHYLVDYASELPDAQVAARLYSLLNSGPAPMLNHPGPVPVLDPDQGLFGDASADVAADDGETETETETEPEPETETETETETEAESGSGSETRSDLPQPVPELEFEPDPIVLSLEQPAIVPFAFTLIGAAAAVFGRVQHASANGRRHGHRHRPEHGQAPVLDTRADTNSDSKPGGPMDLS